MLLRLRAFVSNQKLCFYTLIRHNKQIPTMTDIKPSKIGLPLEEIVDALQKFANTSLAEPWDNVGLLVEPSCPKLISNILLTNDLTENVMNEALGLSTDMIISYHPPIFYPFKSITTRTWKERIIAKCLEHKIAVYSTHTAFDSIKGGVNDWLASAFNNVMDSCKPIQPGENKENGMGRLCTLKNEIHIDEAVNLVKQHTKLKSLQLARAVSQSDGFIKSVAVCAGSGISVLKNVRADLYLTGEMQHHDVLDAIHNGIYVIVTNHSNSERGFLESFASTLSNRLNNSVNVNVSIVDADPLEIV
ncbi:NIF3-like protein 1 isoform X4 [Vespa mandarinia]|uniref:NIF3-like protein 1 isoform X4 n=1 Tax=Vespa mandarinia TaxID=7446 RepID=UPI00161F8CDA|nr:NIF3-like protein 1 isoform X4 [Vespa mandarinia]XP_035724848.1 NIF3-like protein 1 isoform X4 [Vespa mandarinia]XP_035724849.1 NIF3-like protein 1 isoform X4 [Vespa mandarinia]XP_035724850.1 NIF3-like protein 1 isoform X4 [Vespa mandarinia]XP_035724851.1 NIF3-like protein 1 isoform X4 [Vespa mandarinia]